jgi:hypothetical protein
MLHKSDDCGATWSNQFIDIEGMARPGGGTFEFNVPVMIGVGGIAGMGGPVMKIRDKIGSVYGIDTTQIYTDSVTGKLFLATGLDYPDATPNVIGDIPTELLLMSSDNGDSWTIIDEMPNLSRPIAMTSTTVGGRTKLFIAAGENFDLGTGFGLQTLPTVYWYDITGGALFEGAAPVAYDGPSGPIDLSEGLTLAGVDIIGGRNIPNVTISRAPSDTSVSRVRLAYPHRRGEGLAGLEDLYVVEASVPTTSVPCVGYGCIGCKGPDCARHASVDVISDVGTSAVFPHFIEPDGYEYVAPANDQHPSPALLKYQSGEPPPGWAWAASASPSTREATTTRSAERPSSPSRLVPREPLPGLALLASSRQTATRRSPTPRRASASTTSVSTS